MNKVLALLAASLLSLNSSAWAEGAKSADRSADLRYCLELESPAEIAKCAGEIAPGEKGKPYSREHVEKILEQEKQRAPVSVDETPQAPATENREPGTGSPPEQTEGN